MMDRHAVVGSLFLILCISNLGWAASSWDCNFEDGTCLFGSVSTGPASWQRVEAKTTDKDRGGWYISTSGTKGVSTLQSQVKVDADDSHCLTFYLFQTGYWLETVSVLMGRQLIMNKTGDNELSARAHSLWHRIQVNVKKISKPGSLRFVVTRTQEGYSTTSIDDITLTKGRCEEAAGPDCTFERGSCGWRQEGQSFTSTSSETWKKDSFFDHTLKTDFGRFMLARKKKDETKPFKLTSPKLSFTTPVCLRFFYTLIGNRSLFSFQLKEETGDLIWKNNLYNKSSNWNLAEVTIKYPKDKQVSFVFQPTYLKGYDQMVGLDDISFTSGSCAPRGNSNLDMS